MKTYALTLSERSWHTILDSLEQTGHQDLGGLVASKVRYVKAKEELEEAKADLEQMQTILSGKLKGSINSLTRNTAGRPVQ